MHWLIQRKMEQDPACVRLYDNLERMGIHHSFCRAVPFSDDDLTSEIDLDTVKEPIFTYGSYTLAKIARRRGYKPGSFISERFSMDSLLSNYGDELLNNDMVTGPLSDIQTDMPEFFIRPMEDTKSFVAEITSKQSFEEFRNKIIAAGTEHFSTIYPHTKVIISSPKKIEQECRFFIVDKKIVTSSQYKVGDVVRILPIVDSYITEYVQKIISREWEPDTAYCLDIAVSNGIPKVLEINCINSSGLYALDTQKFISAIEDLTERYR